MGKCLGKYIKRIRKEEKYSVKLLANSSGISKSYIDYIENGLREPSPEMLAKIAVSLKTSFETLLKIQQKEQLERAAIALEISNTDLSNLSIDMRTMRRNSENVLDVNVEALKKIKLAFKKSGDEQAVVDSITSPDLRAIVRASINLDDKDITKLRKAMESLYPYAFETEKE
ncbi:MAG TPA: helix-turn-helix domain-containing protein [Desulfosporosinus sp.]|nr:helix-turn-helix domain-containing protein [Desulfosporosinus sp.]